MRIDGNNIEDLSLDQIGAALEELSRALYLRSDGSGTIAGVASDVGEAGTQLRALWCRHAR